MSVVMFGLIASTAGASAWLAIRRLVAIYSARRARLLHGEAGRLRSAILKEIDRLEARHRRLQGSLALADQGGGHTHQRQDLRVSSSRGALTELANLRARTEQAYAAAPAESGVGLRVRCNSLSAIAREVATWAKALSEREAAVRAPADSRLGHSSPRAKRSSARSPRLTFQNHVPLRGHSFRA